MLPIRFTYDERIDDGLTASYALAAFCAIMEDPARYLGSLSDESADESFVRKSDLIHDREINGFSFKYQESLNNI